MTQQTTPPIRLAAGQKLAVASLLAAGCAASILICRMLSGERQNILFVSEVILIGGCVSSAVGAWLLLENIKSRMQGRALSEAALRLQLEITRSITAKEALEESEARFRLFVEGVEDYAMFMTDLEGRIISWNAGGERIYGWRGTEVLGKHFSLLYTVRDRELHKDREYMKIVQMRGRVEFEAWRMRKDGSAFFASILVTTLKDAHSRVCGFASITRDVSERRFMEREILEAREREQERLGRELHDGLTQQLAAIAYAYEALCRRLLASHRPEATEAAQIRQLITDATEQARDLARGVYPSHSVREGLVTALGSLADHTAKKFQMDCRLRSEESLPIGNRLMESQLFLIAQEAVTNAARHARAGMVEIELRREEERLVLSVCDDGTGIHDVPSDNKGIGLRIMNYRAQLIGASLDIFSRPDGGTCVVCGLPMVAIEGPEGVRGL